MASPSKSVWVALLLVVAGGIIFWLSASASKPKPQGVALQDIFKTTSSSVPEPLPSGGEVAPKDPVPSLAIVAETDLAKHTEFAIQVYSFQDKNRAYAAVQSLVNNGYNAYIIVSDLGEKGTWYRVRVGGIKDEANARQVLEQIRKNYNSGFLVKPAVAKR